MEGRKQFTFYRSFYDAVAGHADADRLAVYEIIIAYALDRKMPEGLNGIQKTAFILAKPVLDSAWEKAKAGVISGQSRRTKREQNANKGENKKEKEKEIEKENENEIEIEDECQSASFAVFWDLYPVKVGKEKAMEVWDRLQPDAQAVCDGVKKWKQTKQWAQDQGRFVPRAAKFLEEEHYLHLPADHVPMGASGVLGKAELEAIARVMQT